MDPVLTPQEDPGTSKIIEIIMKNNSFQRNRTFELESLLDLVLAPFGHPFWSLLATKMAETCLEIPLGTPKSRSRDVFFGPGGLQERSKRLPRGIQAAKTAPRALQEAPGSILELYWISFGLILVLICSKFETFWELFL